MRKTTLTIGLLLLACGGGGKTTPKDVPPADIPGESTIPDVAPEAMGTDEGDRDVPGLDVPPDLGSGDEGAPDLGPSDPGQPDSGPADPGPADPGQPDPGQIDPGAPDPGADIGDPGPYYSETVAACIYVVEGLCDKAIQKCDEQLFNLIPDNWMKTCTDFLVGNHETIAKGCETIDNSQTSDPNIELIKMMGPTALKECVDNFQCTLGNIGKIIDIILPFTKGQKPSTSDILGIVAEMCFK